MLALSLFLLGLASGIHCVGMCGGFVAAFTSRKVIAIRSAQPAPWQRLLLFNAGRITSYALAGALAGLAGSAVTSILDAQAALYVLANVMLIAVGLHLAGATSLSLVERIGAPLWRRLQPLAAKAMGGRSAYVAGLLWGWIPCGLVYGALAVAAFAGSAPGGAAAMAAYGLGTLPWLMAGGFAFRWLQRKTTRAIAGATVLAFGVYGLAHGSDLRGLLCL
jgi:sulfite exporter TauE/SafE